MLISLQIQYEGLCELVRINVIGYVHVKVMKGAYFFQVCKVKLLYVHRRVWDGQRIHDVAIRDHVPGRLFAKELHEFLCRDAIFADEKSCFRTVLVDVAPVALPMKTQKRVAGDDSIHRIFVQLLRKVRRHVQSHHGVSKAAYNDFL